MEFNPLSPLEGKLGFISKNRVDKEYYYTFQKSGETCQQSLTSPITVYGYHVISDINWGIGHLNSSIITKIRNLNLSMRKTSQEPRLEGIPQNIWPLLFKPAKVMENKGRETVVVNWILEQKEELDENVAKLQRKSGVT